MKILREIAAPLAPAGVLYPGVIDEDVARTMLGDEFDAAVESGAIEPLIDSLPHRGWPTRAHAERTPDHSHPITRAARFIVRCHHCTFRADSSVETAEAAIASVSSGHDKAHTRYSARPYPEEP